MDELYIFTSKFVCFSHLPLSLALYLITAITIGVRILGPAAGFILGSFCTRLYVDLSDPGFGPSDPKWVGAWYLGMFPGIILFYFIFCIFLLNQTNERREWEKFMKKNAKKDVEGIQKIVYIFQ